VHKVLYADNKNHSDTRMRSHCWYRGCPATQELDNGSVTGSSVG